ncbi:MAG: M14 family metallopeptidase [Planctomycetota bacterium]
MRLATWAGLLLWTLTATSAFAEDLTDYLPSDVTYDPSIPVPKSVLGFEVGEWHVRHDLLVEYMKTVAASSDRMRIEETGRTHEQRPLVMLTVSSPANLARLDDIRRRHRELSEGATEMPSVEGLPAVIWMGYSIHGNESSGSNAALLVAYHLAAAQGEEMKALLDDVVILLDPSLNPDGLARFAQWANMHKGKQVVGNPRSREHQEHWPGGRTNHYWFDLNRDWLLLQHPESRARVEQFHKWRPNILTDHHEMGSDSTFFFQPGIPSRKNPLTPAKNVELTGKIAEYHAEILDQEGRLYYTEESFDDFYYGKGSTYPDVHGSIGILFEQASSRGHLMETSNGPLPFSYTIKNQFLSSLSTMKAAKDLRQDLLAYQHEFYRSALAAAKEDPVQAYVFGEAEDRTRTNLMVELLLAHDIQVHRLGKRFERGERVFEPGTAYIVPALQPQYRLVKAVFERRTEFEDDAFYDVSAWTFPLAFGLPNPTLKADELSGGFIGEPVRSAPTPKGHVPTESAPRFYAFEWSEFFAPRALYRLVSAGLEVRTATKPFTSETDRGRHEFGRGTIVIPMGVQGDLAPRVPSMLEDIASKDGIDFWAVSSGLTPGGIDLGSPSLVEPSNPNVVLVAGGGASSYSVGEIWHLLDVRFEMPVTVVDADDLSRLDWNEVTHLVLVSGAQSALRGGALDDVKSWVRQGGTVIAMRSAANWAGDELVSSAERSEEKADEKPAVRIPYADYEENRAKALVSGAIYETRLDVTHPLGYGYPYDWLPVFRRGTSTLPLSADPYATVAQYVEAPLLAGYSSQQSQGEIAGTAAVIATRSGGGVVIQLADGPNFRAFWHGTNKLFMNSLFFSPLIGSTRDTRQ